MAAKYWLKLYHEMLNDHKVMTLPLALRWRFIETLLVAGEYDQDGYLPEINKYAWRVRDNPEIVETDFVELADVGLLSVDQGRWLVTKFAERQAPVSDAERMRRLRDRKQKTEYYEGEKNKLQGGYENVTNSNAKKSRSDNSRAEEIPDFSSLRIKELQELPEVKLYYDVTHIEPGRNYCPVIWEHINHYGWDKEYLTPFWLAWKSRRTKTGKPYSRTNLAWLTEWAVSGEIPPDHKGDEPVPDHERIRQQLKREGIYD